MNTVLGLDTSCYTTSAALAGDGGFWTSARRLLPVQAAIIAMSSVNTIVDGVVAARFIDASTVGVIGLYYSMLRIL